MPGKYVVAITKTDMPGVPVSEENAADPAPIQVISLIPEKYAVPALSDLTAEIPEEGTDNLVFHLSD